MKFQNSKYNKLNEGRQITNGQFMYGGFPRILKESDAYGSTHDVMLSDIMSGGDEKAKELIKKIDRARGSGTTVDDVTHTLELHKHLTDTLGPEHPHVRGLSSGLKDIHDTGLEFEDDPTGLSQAEREDYSRAVDIIRGSEHALNKMPWLADVVGQEEEEMSSAHPRDLARFEHEKKKGRSSSWREFQQNERLRKSQREEPD